MALDPSDNDAFQALIDGATAMRDLFNSFILAGFTESQAVQLVVGLATASVKKTETSDDHS